MVLKILASRSLHPSACHLLLLMLPHGILVVVLGWFVHCRSSFQNEDFTSPQWLCDLTFLDWLALLVLDAMELAIRSRHARGVQGELGPVFWSEDHFPAC